MGAPVPTWIIHCVNYNSSIRPVPPVLVHQRSDLGRIRFLSHTAVLLITPLDPIVTRLTVRQASTGDMLDPPHILPVR